MDRRKWYDAKAVIGGPLPKGDTSSTNASQSLYPVSDKRGGQEKWIIAVNSLLIDGKLVLQIKQLLLMDGS